MAGGDALLTHGHERVIKSSRARRALRPELEDLSERELEVFRLISRGLSNAEIGKELFISETTVKTHVTHILQKLGLRDRVQAIVLAYQSGLVDGAASRKRPARAARSADSAAGADAGSP